MLLKIDYLCHCCLDKILKILIFSVELLHFWQWIWWSIGIMDTKNCSMLKFLSWFMSFFSYLQWGLISLWTLSLLLPLAMSFIHSFTLKKIPLTIFYSILNTKSNNGLTENKMMTHQLPITDNYAFLIIFFHSEFFTFKFYHHLHLMVIEITLSFWTNKIN